LTPIKYTHPYDHSKAIIFVYYLVVLLLKNMYKHRQRRVVVKKHKSTVKADFEKGGNKRHMNICREVKAPPPEQAPELTDDDVALKIHSPLEDRGSLRENVNYRKQDHNTITIQREIACYDVEKEAYDPCFWTFFMRIGITLCTRVIRSMLPICSGLIGTSFKRRRTIVQSSLKLLLLVNTMGSRMSWN
jgi:hypothetical protein